MTLQLNPPNWTVNFVEKSFKVSKILTNIRMNAMSSNSSNKNQKVVVSKATAVYTNIQRKPQTELSILNVDMDQDVETF